jgi:hypothetical protein
MTDQVKKATQGATSGGEEKWNQMSEEQKKATCVTLSTTLNLNIDNSCSFDALPEEQKQNKTYYEWVRDGYYKQYDSWMPWIEDQYLKWFTKDNKTSYAAKGTPSPSPIPVPSLLTA